MRFRERLTVSFLLLVSFSFTTSAPGQQVHKPLRFITNRDGLPQAFVSSMVQDKEGFVWIGTANGLARYDGLHMKLFQHSSSDSTTLASNAISRLQIDVHNCIWLFYEGNEIDRFDPVTEKLTHIYMEPITRRSSFVSFNVVTHDNYLWTSRGNGLYRCDTKSANVTHFSAKNGHITSDTILAMLEDRQSTIWIATLDGISRYQPRLGRFQLFPNPYRLRLNNLQYTELHERSNGELMLADMEKLVIFNPATGSYRTIPLPNLAPKGVLLMQTGPDGTDYIETLETLYRYDDNQGLLPVLQLSDFSVWGPTALFVDRSGLLWLGLNISGIAQFDPVAPVFDVHPTAGSFHKAFLVKEFGSELEPFLKGVFPGYGTGPLSGHPNYLFRSAWDVKSHRIFAGEKDRVAFSDSSGLHWQLLPPIPEFLHTATEGLSGLRGLDVGPDGKVWVADKRSVSFFDPEKRQWSDFLNTTEKGIDTTLLYYCTSIKADAKKLWIARFKGLLCIDLLTRRIDVITRQTKPGLLPADQLIDMEADPTRPYLLWIGSREGLICLNKKTMTSQVFTTSQGLPNNTIYAIQTDEAGYLWLSTNQGLCRFHPVTYQVRNFRVQNGLPGNEFNTLQYLKLPDGRLAFGGVDGWVTFHPGIIKPDTFQPQIAFTGLKIYNEPVSYSPGNKLLPRPLNDVERLTLPYDQNTLTFEFAGLQYNQPAELQYRYRLDGYDDKWIMTDNPVAGYTKLAPGQYDLQINCTNTTGKWSNHIRSLQVVVLPPWWRTWWAYTLYALIIAGIGYALYRTWLQRVRAKQQIILQQKEAEQLKAVDEMKSRFFSNITHEFRTPLSLILAPLEQIQKKDLPRDLKQELGNVQRNARQLLQLINQLLDMAKLEARSMKLTLYHGNINEFTGQQVQAFFNAAAAKKVQLHFHATALAEEFLFDADKLHTILSNLLSNALKFTPTGGKIEVIIEQEPDNEKQQAIRFLVKDNGIGIASEKLPFIFDRFYQVDNSATRSYGGTGIGMALAKELSELMQGTLTASSEQGKGSVFTLTLPLAKTAGGSGSLYMPVPALAEATSLQNTEAGNYAEMPDTAGKPLILVTEDNEELNAFIVQTFRQHYRVLTAANGLEGLKIATEELPDVILSDWMMPDMDGLSFCQTIKSDAATNHIAFVLLTARAAPLSRIEGLQNGADDYLTKPFIAEELLLRVANILHRQQQLQLYFQKQLATPYAVAETAIPLEQPSTHPFLQQLYRIVETHIDDINFSVEHLAKKAAVSTRTLSRKLSSIINLSPAELIKQYRLQKATELLQQGTGVAETTYLVGYDSPAHFSTIFKTMYGVTPSEYASVNAS